MNVKQVQLALLFIMLSFAASQEFDYPFRLVDDTCTINQCLFLHDSSDRNDYPYFMSGVVKAVGFYETPSHPADLAESKVCIGFTLLRAPESFVAAFRNALADANTVNHLDAENRLVLRLELDSLRDWEVEFIKQTTPESPVTLTLFQSLYNEGPHDDCVSFFEILRVERKNTEGENGEK